MTRFMFVRFIHIAFFEESILPRLSPESEGNMSIDILANFWHYLESIDHFFHHAYLLVVHQVEFQHEIHEMLET